MNLRFSLSLLSATHWPALTLTSGASFYSEGSAALSFCLCAEPLCGTFQGNRGLGKGETCVPGVQCCWPSLTFQSLVPQKLLCLSFLPACILAHILSTSAPPAAALVEIKRYPNGETGGEGWLRAAALRRKLTPRPGLQQQLVALHPASGAPPT